MCSPAKCKTCGKTTWSGCGQHVDQVMRNVPTNRQCDCKPGERRASSGLLGKLLGR